MIVDDGGGGGGMEIWTSKGKFFLFDTCYPKFYLFSPKKKRAYITYGGNKLFGRDFSRNYTRPLILEFIVSTNCSKDM